MIKKTLLLLVLSIILVSTAEITYEEEVAVLNEGNFDQFINQNKFTLIEFYAPWCGHCKQLAPEYSAAAEMLKFADPVVPLAKVDATENPSLGDRFNVQGYPTLKFFAEGQALDYNGPRDKDGIVAWVKRQTGPASTEIQSIERYEKFLSDNEVAILFFGDSIESHEYRSFENLARINQEQNVSFGHVLNNVEIRQAAKVAESGNQLVIFKHFDELRNDFQGEIWDTSDIQTNFIEKHIFPIIMPFTQSAAERMFGDNQKGNLILIVSESEASTQASQALDEVKNQIKDSILLCRTDMENEMGERLGEYLNLSADQLPVLLIMDVKGDDMNKYFYQGGVINAQSIPKFVESYQNNELEVTLLSQEIPVQQEGPVRQLVGKNFNEVTQDQGKDVLVKFYAEWCGHCQQLAPIYADLARKYADDENVIIAEIDYTKNEVKGVNVEGFPTIILYPAGGAEQLNYEGDRTEEDMVQFVNANRKSSHSVKRDDL